MTTVRIDRADLERLASAATAFAALQRLKLQMGAPTIAAHAVVDGVRTPLTPGPWEAEIADLEHAVIRTRRLLGWRR